jgi:predicted RNase H-like nuclease (RuvC/YqgF family)
MSEPCATPRTAAANLARRQTTQHKLRSVENAIKAMRRERASVTYPAIAQRAGVSRTFLYDNTDARTLMQAAVTRNGAQRSHDQADHDAPAEASWRERALNAEEALKAAHAEIRTQRDRIGRLLGQLRDLEHELPADTIHRTTTENTTLKQRVRQLSRDNRTLEERLQAARSNVRFADRRIAQLEAQLLEQATDAR